MILVKLNCTADNYSHYDNVDGVEYEWSKATHHEQLLPDAAAAQLEAASLRTMFTFIPQSGVSSNLLPRISAPDQAEALPAPAADLSDNAAAPEMASPPAATAGYYEQEQAL